MSGQAGAALAAFGGAGHGGFSGCGRRPGTASRQLHQLQTFQSPAAAFVRYEEPSPPYTMVSSGYTTGSEQFEFPPAKRQRLLSTSSAVAPTATPIAAASGGANTAVQKSRRVRTGCLTCRERHLKCDEGTPVCLNCRKSNRECKRGVRLNFLDVRVEQPPFVPSTEEWKVQFQDESRLIASEYRGGLGRYGRPATPPHVQHATMAAAPQHQQLALQSALNTFHNPFAISLARERARMVLLQRDFPSVASSLVPQAGGGGGGILAASQRPSPQVGQQGTPPQEKTTTTTGGERDFLGTSDEIHFMQVFVSEVALWMDVLDRGKHFARSVPFLALKSPMLMDALLACGVKHQTLVACQDDPNHESRALCYYDTATTQLLRSLGNPDRNTAECATTAAVLNVYDIMSERPAQRMSHIAGSRALIRECGWDARTPGVGQACFWLNIGMEVISCLAFGWQTAWDPDRWGLDMDLEGSHEDMEELWVHRMLYIVAKIANFRANMPKCQEASPHDEQARLQSRFAEWTRLKALCDAWNKYCPRPMSPLGYDAGPSPASVFPNVWLVARPAVVGRLLYHTAMMLLAQMHPLRPRRVVVDLDLDDGEGDENRAAQLHHARQVCGIVAHTPDRGVASVAIRSLAFAAAVLPDRAERDEVLRILDRIRAHTAWRLDTVLRELEAAWGHPVVLPSVATGLNQANQNMSAQARPPVNPLLREADFNMPNHPYKNFWAPPNRANLSVTPAWSG